MYTMEVKDNGNTVYISHAILVEFDTEKKWINPINDVDTEVVKLTFDMAMPFIPTKQYVIILDNLLWGVECISETVTHTAKGVRAEYFFKRVV